jgi:hypothetical protein
MDFPLTLSSMPMLLQTEIHEKTMVGIIRAWLPSEEAGEFGRKAA